MLEVFVSILLSFILGCLFALLCYGAGWLITKARDQHRYTIPPYIQGKPEVTFKGPVRNRMRHVLSF